MLFKYIFGILVVWKPCIIEIKPRSQKGTPHCARVSHLASADADRRDLQGVLRQKRGGIGRSFLLRAIYRRLQTRQACSLGQGWEYCCTKRSRYNLV